MRYAILALLLTGCAGLPDAPREVFVPVAVSCVDTLPDRPALVTDAELLAMPDAAFVLALAADRLERGKWMAVAEATLQACVK